MNKVLAVLVIVLSMSFLAWASPNNSCQFASCNDNSTNDSNNTMTINNITNIDETYQTFEEKKIENAYGPGVDVVLYENKAQSVGAFIEYRYNANSDAHNAYGVVRVNPWKLLSK